MALASCLVAVLPTLGLTAVMSPGLGNAFMYAPLPFRVSMIAAGIWISLVILGAILATDAAATRASGLTVREALADLCRSVSASYTSLRFRNNRDTRHVENVAA